MKEGRVAYYRDGEWIC